jgi:hypothetical protein
VGPVGGPGEWARRVGPAGLVAQYPQFPEPQQPLTGLNFAEPLSARTVADLARAFPAASWAWTAKNGPLLDTLIAVSKSVRRTEPAGLSDEMLLPASTVHDATSVAPFQLA